MHEEQHGLDAEFERWLLDSARQEALPSALTGPAWERFVEAGGRAAVGVASGAGLSLLGVRIARASMAWFAAGLISGSGLTLALSSSRQGSHAERMPAAPALPAPATRGRGSGPAHGAAATSGPPAMRQGGHDTAEAPSSPKAERGAAEATEAVPRARRKTPSPTRSLSRASTLGAEVQALDAVGAAIAAGQYGDALDAVTVFHEMFPRAQLAADAEGLAIEALLGQNDFEGAALRARRFLRRYPHDPHAPRFVPIAEGRR